MILDHLFLSAFSRYPNESEKTTILGELERESSALKLDRKQARRAAIEDLMWALLTKKEFLFNH